MSAPDPLEGKPDYFDGRAWLEYLRNRHAAGGDMFAPSGEAEAALRGYVSNNKSSAA